MGNCFSDRMAEEHNLDSGRDKFYDSSSLKGLQENAIRRSFPPGLERKLVKNKAPVIDKRLQAPLTRDAPEAMITNKSKSVSDLSLIHNSLGKHFIFRNLSKEQLDLIVHEMKFYSLPENSLIIEQGKPGNNFFVIDSGRVEVLVDNQRRNILNAGDSFGELALLQDKPRSASVKTLEISNLWGVDRGTFREALQAINAANYMQNKNFIETVPIFQVLTNLQRELLLSSVSTVNYSQGQRIVSEGDTGDLFYLIKEGSVNCSRDGVLLRKMAVGEYFGEQALLYSTPRTATVVADEEVKCLVISREDLTQALGSQLNQIIYKNSIRIAFDRSSSLKNFDDSQAKNIIALMQVKSFEHNSVVIQRGTRKNSALHVMVNGKLQDSNEKIIAEIFSVLGEEEIVKGSTECYDELRAIGRVDIASITKQDFNLIIGGSLDKITADSTVLNVLKKVNLFRGLSDEKLKSLTQLLDMQEFQEGEIIFNQNTPGESFFVLKSGRVDAIKNDVVIRTINKLDYFGERSILFNELRTATVKAVTKVECWVLHKSEFFRVIDEKMRNMLQKRIQLQDENITLQDLIIVKKLGQGMFGNVFLAGHKTKKNLYALKTIDRKKIDNEKIQESLILERKILMQLDHMLILKLIKTFKDEKRLYFLLEYVRGQDLFDVIRELGLVTNKDAKFYAACLLIIFEHLHERDIVYRDLKPENVMIDEEGYPKLIDFGTAKIVQGRTYTMIGTPHYMAPEVILGKGYGISADYWSLGIMIYEFICGGVPFGENDSDSYAIYEKVLSAKITYPNYAKPTNEAKSFIEQLLNKNSALRYGGSLENLKMHAWIKDTDWEKILERKENAPFLPTILNLNWEIEKAYGNIKNLNQVIAYEEKLSTLNYYVPKNPNWDEDF